MWPSRNILLVYQTVLLAGKVMLLVSKGVLVLIDDVLLVSRHSFLPTESVLLLLSVILLASKTVLLNPIPTIDRGLALNDEGG